MINFTRTVLATATLTALVLSGCGAAGTAAAPTIAPAPPTATATAAPTPTADLTAAAGAAYLAAATTANAAGTALNTTVCGHATVTLAQSKGCWSQSETIDRVFLTTIFGINYPTSMKTDVDAQITAQTEVVADDAAMVASPGDAATYNIAMSDVRAETGTANIVRHDLGLPQVPA